MVGEWVIAPVIARSQTHRLWAGSWGNPGALVSLDGGKHERLEETERSHHT